MKVIRIFKIDVPAHHLGLAIKKRKSRKFMVGWGYFHDLPECVPLLVEIVINYLHSSGCYRANLHFTLHPSVDPGFP